MNLTDLLIIKAVLVSGYTYAISPGRDKAMEIVDREISLKKLEKNPTGSENEMSQR